MRVEKKLQGSVASLQEEIPNYNPFEEVKISAIASKSISKAAVTMTQSMPEAQRRKKDSYNPFAIEEPSSEAEKGTHAPKRVTSIPIKSTTSYNPFDSSLGDLSMDKEEPTAMPTYATVTNGSISSPEHVDSPSIPRKQWQLNVVDDLGNEDSVRNVKIPCSSLFDSPVKSFQLLMILSCDILLNNFSR